MVMMSRANLHVATVTFLLVVATGNVTAATVILDPAQANRDPVWVKESFAQNAWTIHSPETLYKIVSAKMVWPSFSGAAGTYSLRVKVFAKSNGEAPIWVKVDGVEVWRGVTPLPYGLKTPYCCGSNNKRDCAKNLGLGEIAWINTGKKVSLKKGSVIEFWGKTAYWCQPSTWKSGEKLTGYGGGTYSSIFVMEWTADGTSQPATPVLKLDTTQISFKASLGGNNPSPITVSARNTGGGTLPALKVTENADWLSVTITGTGNSQQLVNSVNITGKAQATYTTAVTVAGTGLATVSYNARLEIASGEAKPVTVISPNGGEKLAIGQSVTIKWTTDSMIVPMVDLFLTLDSGKTFLRINDINSIDRSSQSWGNYVWKIPAAIDGVPLSFGNCKIRIADYPTAMHADLSDGFFTISAASSVGKAQFLKSATAGNPGVYVINELTAKNGNQSAADLFTIRGELIRADRSLRQHRGAQSHGGMQMYIAVCHEK